MSQRLHFTVSVVSRQILSYLSATDPLLHVYPNPKIESTPFGDRSPGCSCFGEGELWTDTTIKKFHVWTLSCISNKQTNVSLFYKNICLVMYTFIILFRPKLCSNVGYVLRSLLDAWDVTLINSCNIGTGCDHFRLPVYANLFVSQPYMYLFCRPWNRRHPQCL